MTPRTSALFILLGSLLYAQHVLSGHPLSRHVEILNKSGKNMQIYWINPKTGEEVKFTEKNTIKDGSSFSMNSFVNHTLSVRQVANESVSCDDDESCHVNYVTISEKKGNQIYYIEQDMTVDLVDTRRLQTETKATETLAACKQQALKSMDMELMTKCLENAMADEILEKNEETSMEAKARAHVSDKLENYTCADNDLPTTAAEEIRTWTHDGTLREVHVLHNREASQIHVLKNFISPEECQAIEDAAAPSLHRGTVADGSGGSRLSDHRKAWQSGVKIPWDKEAEGDLIARVVRRLYDYTNDATGYGLEVEGQEDIMSIQYFEPGEDEKAPDQYRPHCDGDCAGLPHKTGGRVATMVMYCTVPTRGGSTNFGHSGIHVKPELGAAAFFSYMNPETHEMEQGFTSHSGCPVLEGTKRIAVQWMRLGVDKENPWDSFNTLTVRKGQEEDC